jgi:hypothetical protein
MQEETKLSKKRAWRSLSGTQTEALCWKGAMSEVWVTSSCELRQGFLRKPEGMLAVDFGGKQVQLWCHPPYCCVNLTFHKQGKSQSKP